MRSKLAKVFVITMMFALIGTLTACGGGSGKQDAPKEVTKEEALAYADKVKEEDYYPEDWNGEDGFGKEGGVKGVVADYKTAIEAADPSEYETIMADFDKTLKDEVFTKAVIVESLLDGVYEEGEKAGLSTEDCDKIVEEYRSKLEEATTHADVRSITVEMYGKLA